MTNYREQVQRVIAIHHARLELSLSKAREQERFVQQVDEILTRNHITHRFGLTRDFDVIFRLPANLMQAENFLQTLFTGHLLTKDKQGWVLSDGNNECVQVHLMQENDDGL